MDAPPKRRSLKSRIRRPIYNKIAQWREKATNASPPWMQKHIWPAVDWLDMILIDHGIFRIFYANRHKLGDDAWRAAQPWPHQVRYYANKGIKTIVNLRGDRDCGSYRLERDACEKYGVKLVNYKMRSGAPPEPEVVTGFQEFFEKLEYPILLHCKSGADRAGIASTLFMYLNKEEPLDEALDQMHVRFGHFKHAKTGVLDHFFASYQAENERRPIDFMEWVKTKYDPVSMKANFKSGFWSSFIVEKILRRE